MKLDFLKKESLKVCCLKILVGAFHMFTNGFHDECDIRLNIEPEMFEVVSNTYGVAKVPQSCLFLC